MPTILLISFGTAHGETRQKSIDALAQSLRQTYPDYEVRQAFTSSAIIRRLAQQGIAMDNVPQALERLKQEGCQQLYILPTHLFPGGEYTKLLAQLEPYRRDFPLLSVAKPLISEESDRETITAFLQKAYPPTEGEAVLLMAHGSEQDLSHHYNVLNALLKQHTAHIWVAAMEGEPSLDTVLEEILFRGFRKVKLLPLMLSAGAHAVKDMAGEQESSWKSRCLAAGLEVDCILTGLGEAEEIRQLYLRHLQNFINAQNPPT